MLSLAGQSGRGRQQWDSSCWLKLGITRPCRGCSRPLTSTRRAWCRIWTPARPSTSTGGPPRPHRPCRDRSYRGFCCTGCRGAAILPHPRLCPLCRAGFLGLLSGERSLLGVQHLRRSELRLKGEMNKDTREEFKKDSRPLSGAGSPIYRVNRRVFFLLSLGHELYLLFIYFS